MRRPPSHHGFRTPTFVLGALAAGPLATGDRVRQAPEYSGYAEAGCAPWDGGAVRVVLTRGPGPAARDSLELWAFASIGEVVGRSITMTSSPPHTGNSGTAVYCPRGERCRGASGGAMVIERRAINGTLTGHFRLVLEGQPLRSGRFIATWRPTRPLCG